MSSSLSRLADNLSEGLHKDKCKHSKSDLEFVVAKENTLAFKCVDCNTNYKKGFNRSSHKISKHTQTLYWSHQNVLSDVAERGRSKRTSPGEGGGGTLTW